MRGLGGLFDDAFLRFIDTGMFVGTYDIIVRYWIV